MSQPLLRGPFLRATAANFFFFLNFASFFLLPLHIKELGGSEAVVGAVMGTAGLAALAVLPAVGLTIDRLGRRGFLLFGAFGMTLASLGYIFVTSIGVSLFALRLLQGMSFAAAFTATTTFAADFAPFERRAQALGIFGLSTLLTHAIAPSLGEEIVRHFEFTGLFGLTAVFTILSLLLGLGLPAGGSPGFANPQRDQAVAGRLSWVVAVTVMLAGMGFGSVMTFIPTYMHSEALGRVGIFFGAYTTTAILTRLVGAGLSDSFGRRRVILPTLLALAASILTLAFARGVPLLIVAGAIFGTAQGLSYPTLHAFVVDLSSEANLGRTQALFNGAFNLGVTSSAFIFGLVAEHFGYRSMFACAAVAPMAAWAVFYTLARPRPIASRASQPAA